ncbi:hypothetical protein [Longitalea luteola]|uniref:hypothetical protein n=1 Tax=Longitalea luteola TaxID=2812563 RepID=UPI001A95A268|nr:hypothetical protein [Longitalea luteola]
MTSELFVKQLKLLTPSVESFSRLGYPPDLVEKNIKSYICLPADSGQNIIYANSELLKLVSFYNCSSVQVGLINFRSAVEEIENYYLIGNFDADLLAVSKITLEVVVLDYTNLDWIIWHCASNGARFLDAILAAAECISRCVNDTSLAYDNSYTLSYVLKCSQLAGGDKYKEFYKTLLGYDE